ncbi:MAG: hypothetical protein QGH37_31195 [Candidatus Poribacteria bacterium]|nr:hypothetical protein [Candidatus Poribacteria bacterium]
MAACTLAWQYVTAARIPVTNYDQLRRMYVQSAWPHHRRCLVSHPRWRSTLFFLHVAAAECRLALGHRARRQS